MKVTKGNFGYLKSQKKREILRTLLYFAISAAVFLLGLLTTHTRANLLTVVAMLGMLPASKSLVGVIIFLRAKNCSEEIYQKTLPHVGTLPMLYELVLTSYDKNYAISSITCKNNIVCGYSEDEKFDVPAARKHILDILKQNACKPGIELFKEFHSYTQRLESLQQLEETKDNNDEKIRNVIKAISL